MTDAWVLAACTLPSVEQPVRVAELDRLLAGARDRQRPAPTHLRLLLAGEDEDAVRDLVAREAACCSFFTFTVHPTAAGLRVDVEVPPAYAHVLDALAARP